MSLKYVAAYLMSALAGNESPSAKDIKKILESVEDGECDDSIASSLVAELEGKTIHEVIAEGKEKLKGFGGGGGGGGVAVAAAGGGGGDAAPAAAKKEEKKIEEEEEEEDDEEDEDARPQTTSGGLGGGSTEADRVYNELLRRGAFPAIVVVPNGKRKREDANGSADGNAGDEVELELFTEGAAKKAKLIRDEDEGRGSRRGRRGAASMFESLFGF
mmetsp:Transcript_104333/g.294159  ORF Transcript_104333/g.294159 Transcript_104333/m.294159 type:complete len:216 (+) Transcript_104333:86-733(+)